MMNDVGKVVVGLYFMAWSMSRRASEIRMVTYKRASGYYLKASFLAIKAMNAELDRWTVK